MTHQYGPQPPQGYASAPQHFPPPKKKRTGLIIALVLIGCLVLMGGCAALLANAGSGAGGTTASAEKEPTSSPTAKKSSKPKPKAPGIGDVVKDGTFSFKVTKLERRNQVGGSFLNKDAQGVFVLVHVTVKNVGDSSQAFLGGEQKLFDAKGREFDADTEAAIYLTESKSLYEDINPGNSVRGIVMFDVPKNAKVASVELHDSVFSDGVKVDVR